MCECGLTALSIPMSVRVRVCLFVCVCVCVLSVENDDDNATHDKAKHIRRVQKSLPKQNFGCVSQERCMLSCVLKSMSR